MPVRSLRSSVLVWPGRREVEAAVTAWAEELAGRWPRLAAVGFFGSYARGDWGVGSDIDLLLVLDSSAAPFGSRAVPRGGPTLPVPSDHLIYTQDELESLMRRGGRFADVMRRETLWVFRRGDFPGFPA